MSKGDWRKQAARKEKGPYVGLRKVRLLSGKKIVVMIGGNNMSQALYWSIYDQPESDTAIDALIASDNLEKLLEVKTLSFELRSQSEALIDYLSKVPTLRKLLRLVFAVAEPNDLTEKAIDVLQNSENLRGILQTIVTTPELLTMPFDAIARNVPKLTAAATDPLQPATLCQPFVYKGFNKLMNAIFWSTKRIPYVVSFLNDNPRYLRAWAAHTVNQMVTDSLQTFIIEGKDRSEEINKSISQLAVKTGLVDVLVAFLTDTTDTVSFECVTSASSMLSQMIYKNVVSLSEHVIQRVPVIAQFVMRAQLTGLSLLRIHHASDVLICALSTMITTTTYACIENAERLQKVGFDIVKKRTAQLDAQLKETKVSAVDAAKGRPKREASDIEGFRITEIDAMENKYMNIFLRVINLLNLLPERIAYMCSLTPKGTCGYGVYTILDLIARFLAISADVRNFIFLKRNGGGGGKDSAWLEANTAQANIMADASHYGVLSGSAQAGAGGAFQIDLLETTVVAGSIPIAISVATICRKLVALSIPTVVLDLFTQYPYHSNLHFVISRIFLPLTEFGAAAPDISMAILRDTGLLKLMNESVAQFIPFKLRDSRITYYITFARAFLRIAVRLPDELAADEKRSLVDGRAAATLTTISMPQTIPALRRLLREGYDDVNRELAEFLIASEDFVSFSKNILEPEEELPKAFGDARLTSDYAAATKQKREGRGDKPEDMFGGGFGWGGDGDGATGNFFGGFADFSTSDATIDSFFGGPSGASEHVEGQGDRDAFFGGWN